MVGGEAGAPAQREPEPHGERGRVPPAVPAVCPTPLGTADKPSASHGTQGTRGAHSPPRSRRGGAEGTAGSRMKNFVIAQIVLNMRQWLSRPCQPPARRAAGKDQLSAPAAPQKLHPRKCPRLRLKHFVPRQGHAAPCPFPAVTAGVSARSGGVSEVHNELPGCLVRDEAAPERCESLVTDGAAPGRRNSVSPENGAPHD